MKTLRKPAWVIATGCVPSGAFGTLYLSVYTVDTNGHVDETYLPAIGQNSVTQDITHNYNLLVADSKSTVTAVVHSGWVSVLTVAANTNDIDESYLSAIGQGWQSQDLTSKYGAPKTSRAITAIVHDGWTSVFARGTDDHLWETFLPAIGNDWKSQDLTSKYGVPAIDDSGILFYKPVALYYSGYLSVYTVNAADKHLEESYLPAIGGSWIHQDMTVNFNVPIPNQKPSPLLHYGLGGGLTWVSVFPAASNYHLNETYLPAVEDLWARQDLHDNYGVPPT